MPEFSVKPDRLRGTAENVWKTQAALRGMTGDIRQILLSLGEDDVQPRLFPEDAQPPRNLVGLILTAMAVKQSQIKVIPIRFPGKVIKANIEKLG